ncbi:hypothetical protein [Paradevosia shaoguanensis]|uniref:Uncharacterized protein n=1 Tax=Paradevosia shaoguanensis TaxID=1335043 RepID=A0AA41QMF8_9HYPH|nr:hypothetical protein [Paradevosia shaoguanensis]MCF1743092.1 hypothetical protein [Paradevosia shaoguanensis]MCI0127575.1 hypothetical protein [Paradevosia shaoguanensis]
MTAKSVLAIGIDPAFADLSAHPELSVDLVRAYIDQQIGRIRELGYEADSCLIDSGETAEAVVEEALRSHSYDCIVIGAGLREPPEFHLLFEKIVNLIHRSAPTSKIAFNTTPADTAEAAQRWMV